MREVTDEMVAAYGEAWERVDKSNAHGPAAPGDRRRAGLQAVFDLIERDSPKAAVKPEWEARRNALIEELDQGIKDYEENADNTGTILQSALNDYVRWMSNTDRSDSAYRANAAARLAQAMVYREHSILDRLWAIQQRRMELGY